MPRTQRATVLRSLRAGALHLQCALDAVCCSESALSTDSYLSLLRAGIEHKAVREIKRVYAHLLHHRVPLGGIIGDHLIIGLAKCGALQEAVFASYALPYRTVFSWTAIISAYVEAGDAYEALRMYQFMQQDGVQPDPFTFVSLFKACSITLDLEYGKKLHVIALFRGFVSDVFVCSAIVNMYGKCGAVQEAELAFGRLSRHSVVSWSAMLSIYIEHREGKKALLLYRQMKEEGVKLDDLTVMLTLQACTIIAENEESLFAQDQAREVALEIGHALHAEATRNGFISSEFLGNTLLNMYGRCGSSEEAEFVFTALPNQDVVTWNAMILAYIEQGEGYKALQLYMQMQICGVNPDCLSTVFAIQACATIIMKEENFIVVEESAKLVTLKIGQLLHIDACCKGFDLDEFVGCSLVKVYGKSDAIDESEQVFRSLAHRDITSWNTMLSVYVEQMQLHDVNTALFFGQKALLLYRQMEHEDVDPDPLTTTLALQACAALVAEDRHALLQGQSVRVIALEIGKAVHADVRRKGFMHVSFIRDVLMTMYGRCGTFIDAQHVFSSVLQQDSISWNSMISLYVEQGLADKALQLYTQMHKIGINSDEWTFVVLLQACAALLQEESSLPVVAPSLEIGWALHAVIHRKGFASDPFVGSTLVTMYGKCGAIKEAELIFSSLSQRTVVSWTAMLSVYVEQGHAKKAFDIYREMIKQGVCLNYITFNCILQACGTAGSLETCKGLHFDIVASGCDKIISVAATLIHTYGGCASMVDGQSFFEKLLSPDIVSWNACISGHVAEGNFLRSIDLFERLKLEAVKPDDVTFTVVLAACSHVGLVSKGLEYFNSMNRDYGLMPTVKHYCSIVDLLGRVGDLEGLHSILLQMPMHADSNIWMCILGGASIYRNSELAKFAFCHVRGVQPFTEAMYVP